MYLLIKNFHKKIFFFIISIFIHLIHAQELSNKLLKKIEVPSSKFNEQIIKHSGFTLMYSEIHEQARWVAYEINSNMSLGQYSRSNKFKKDQSVTTMSASDEDYRYSGYDRGHLAPAADMSYSYEAMQESFLYSNISPQVPEFNRGIWKNLESQIRTWGSKNKLYVVTGPVLKSNLKTIGPNKVSVPEYYYKALLGISKEDTLGIAFMLPNTKFNNAINFNVISIDSLEKVVNLDFFHLLPDEIENKIEKSTCFSCWDWSSNSNETIKYQNSVTSVQCKGLTLSGLRCRRKTKNLNGLCFQHQNQN
jgi:endonuclease G